MAAADTSFYNTQSPLQQLGQTINTAQGISSQNLLQQQVQGKQAMGQLFASAPRDQYGNPDTNYLMQNAGAAGIMAPEVMQQAQAIKEQTAKAQTALAGLTDANLAVHRNINATISSETLPIISDIQNDIKNGTYDPDKTQAKVGNAYAGVIAASAGEDGKPNITAAQATQHMYGGVGPNGQRIPGINWKDPNAVISELKDQYAKSQMALGNNDKAWDIKRGILGTAEVAGGTQPTVQDPSTGAVSPAGNVIPTGKGFNPKTGQTEFNSAQPNQFYGSAGQQNGAASTNQAPSESASPVPTNNQQSSAAPTSPTTQTAQKAGTSPLLPEAPPNYSKELDAARDEANSFISQGNNAIKLEPSLKGVLQLANAGGPNQPLFNSVVGKLKDTPLGGLFNVDATPQAKFEILDKFASDVSGQNMSNNARNELESSVQALSNPNSAQFPQALQTVSKFLLGRVEEAKAHADYLSPIVSQPNAKPSDIMDAQQAWRDHYDQNIFELPYMNDDEKKNLAASHGDPNGKEAKKFEDNLKFMAQHKLISADDF